jgi:hypothetical protein
MTKATDRQIKLLTDLQSYLRRDITETDTALIAKAHRKLWQIAKGAESAANETDAADAIADYLVTRNWLTVNPGETLDVILARLVALRAHIAGLTPDAAAALDGRTASRYIDAAKALQR